MNMLDNNPIHGDSACGCGRNSHHKHFKNCVEDVLETILKAQQKAKQDAHCTNSCQRSIEDLLGKKKRVTKNTIPFILFCGCEPFKGTGVLTYSCHSKRKKFKCVNSFIFKIKELNKGCAVLELLIFKSDFIHSESSGSKHIKHQYTPCCQVDNKNVNDLIRTGICINVDLSCFCSVTCLPAVYL